MAIFNSYVKLPEDISTSHFWSFCVPILPTWRSKWQATGHVVARAQRHIPQDPITAKPWISVGLKQGQEPPMTGNGKK